MDKPAKPMRVLIVIDALTRGGQERQMLEHIKGLTARSEPFDVYLVSLTDCVEYEYVYDLPIRFQVIKRKFKKDITIAFRLKSIITSFRPDIIHSWGTMSSVLLSFANLFSKVPFVNSILADAFAGLDIRDKNYLRVKLTTPFSDVLVANSEAGIRAYRAPTRKTVCIHNGVDFSRFEHLRPAVEVETEILGGPKQERIVLAMAARFDETKDYGTLIGAAIKLCTKRKDIVFLLIGSGSPLEELKASVPAELGRQIIFTGRRNDVESVLQIVDICLLITYYEGLSNSIIEYMAMGKPVIATDGGGTAELVKDDFNGYLVGRKNESQIIARIETLLNNPELRRMLGQNGYQWVRQQFDLREKTNEYIHLYKKLIGEREKSA